MRIRRPILAATLLLLAACGDSPTETRDTCNAVALPFTGDAGGPTVTNVSLEVQASGIVVLASATHPDGTEDLLNVTQTVGVFANLQCTGTLIVLEDDLSGSGVEESFGLAVDMVLNPTLYNTIAASTAWPVAVDFRDADGNRTTGRVMATVID